jgi:hypothetical protein
MVTMTDMTTDSMTSAVRAMVADQFERIRQGVGSVTDGLSPATAVWRPDADANSVAWLLWHLTRIQDDHVAHLADKPQVWTSGGWFERFALPFEARATGFGQTSADVAAVRVAPADLAAYHAEVHELSLSYAAALTTEELARIVDTRWDPPVTASVRLVSLLGDALKHLGQAQYVRGLAQRAGIG